MIVVGGVYTEECVSPNWNAIFGSGGRAAAALSKLISGIELFTYCPSELVGSTEAAFSRFEFTIRTAPATDAYTFSYFHPLSSPSVYQAFGKGGRNTALSVSGPVIIRFGFLEGDAVVDGDTVIYDPQNANPESFSKNGSRAKKLAYVLNRSQLTALTGAESAEDGARQLIRDEDAKVVVVKSGFLGVLVVTESAVQRVPAYYSERIFKIGSGDVFTAAFAYYWAVRGLDPQIAADKASRSVAWYCNTRSLPLPDADDLDGLKPISMGDPGKIYLAGPFFTIGQAWLIEEAILAFESLGVPVFSPLHEIGYGPSQTVATADLAGLQGCNALIALADGRDLGTIFEVGYARANGIPVTCFAERLGTYEKTMLVGTNCNVVDDFASAIYRAAWTTIA